MRDPRTRDRYLPQALRFFAEGGPGLPTALLAEVFPARPQPVLAALRERLARPGDGADEVLLALAGLDEPALALHAAGLVRQYVDSHPEPGRRPRSMWISGWSADRRPAPCCCPWSPGCCGTTRATGGARRRGRVLAAPGSPASRPLRAELLEVLLAFEQDTGREPEVLDALLGAAAAGSDLRPEVRTRALVHRTGMLLVRTPEGASRFDRRLIELAREVPGFAALVTRWLDDAPQEWAAVVGPSAGRTLESLHRSQPAMPMPMQAVGCEHGSLRPA
ncbi:hypothetical protein NKH18_37185 [Streptomyces sp. M10(2022)]